MRFFSDYVIIPNNIQDGNLNQCHIERNGVDYTTLCLPFWFLIYYTTTALVFDLAPLGVIIFFHHNSFKHNVSRSQDTDHNLDRNATLQDDYNNDDYNEDLFRS